MSHDQSPAPASPEPCTELQPPCMRQALSESERNPFLLDEAQESSSPSPCPPLDLFSKKSKGLRLQATRFFLTFPQNETQKEVALERLKEMFKDNLKGALIAQESHQGELVF